MSALRKVLVVDDDPVAGNSIDRVLSAKGYAVVTAENGRDIGLVTLAWIGVRTLVKPSDRE